MAGQTGRDNNQSMDSDRTPPLSSEALDEPLQPLTYQPVISLITPVFNPPEQYLRDAIESVLAQTYPDWELCLADDASTEPHVRPILEEYAAQDTRIKVAWRTENGHISAASNTALELATGEFVACLDHDDILEPEALYEIALCLNQHPDADMVYTDEDHMSDDYQTKYPYIKSSWCPDTFLSWMYTCHLSVYRRSLLEQLGGFRLGYEGSQDYDLVLRLSEQTQKIFHLPKILYHWRVHSGSVNFGVVEQGNTVKTYAYQASERALKDALTRRGEPGRVLTIPEAPGFYNIRYDIVSPGLVSIIVSISGADGLDRCLRSLFEQSTYPNYEVIVVSNDSTDATIDSILAQWQTHAPDRLQFCQVDGPANFSQLNHTAVRQSQGNYLLFLSGTIEVTTPDWIEAMVEQAQRPSIGAVGACLLNPDHTIQHSGIILGKGVVAESCQIWFPTIRNFSAVSADCLMCRREVFEAVGGFAEQLPVAFPDVDLCLKMQEQGYRTVCLPHVRLHHHGTRQSYGTTPADLLRYSQEIDWILRERPAVREPDRCFSPLVTRANAIPSVSVVVPWWDHTEFLPLWERNLQHFPTGTEIIFVDNGSASDGEQALRQFCQQHGVTLIRNETNRGFAAANNQGLAIACGEYMLHLNNDIEILQLPLAYLCAKAGNGISGPGLLNNKLNRPYVEGWALCIRRAILQELGGWNEEYGPGYWDDVDLCHRAELAGYPLVPVPGLERMILHKMNATGRDGRLDQIALHDKNRGKFVRRYFSITPKILIDGICFQLEVPGATSIWTTLLEAWSQSELAPHLVILDRGETAPKIRGIRSRILPAYSSQYREGDRKLLQEICDEESADLFISTYYTAPLTTSMVSLCYDLAPNSLAEQAIMGPEKLYSLSRSSACVCLSAHTKAELLKTFPTLDPPNITVAYCGIDANFKVASPAAVQAFRQQYSLHRPYLLLVESGLSLQTFELFFEAFTQLVTYQGFDLVWASHFSFFPDRFRPYTAGCTVHNLSLSEADLNLAYAGAVALVYLPEYEGSGALVAAALASGCPVITCPTTSLPEISGDAALYVELENVDTMVEALCEVQKPWVRQQLIETGLQQVQQFSWPAMAEQVSQVLLQATL